MGAKTKITQAPTLTPEQKALLDYQIRGVMGMTQGFNLGTGWGGPSFESYNPRVGYGGQMFDMGPAPAAGAGQAGLGGPPAPKQAPAPAARASFNPMMAALQSVAIPGSPGIPGGAPGMVSPTSAAAYSNRENLVSPFVNPFRRNSGG